MLQPESRPVRPSVNLCDAATYGDPPLLPPTGRTRVVRGRFPVSRVAKLGALLDEVAETLVVVANVVVGSGGMGDAEEFLQVANHSDAVSVACGVGGAAGSIAGLWWYGSPT